MELKSRLTSMQILVMQKGTGLYLGKKGAWGKHKHRAQQFKTSTQALDHCLAKRVNGVDFLLDFEDAKWNILVPSVLDGTPI